MTTENPFIDLGFRTYSEKALTYPRGTPEEVCDLLMSCSLGLHSMLAREREVGPYEKRKLEDHKRAVKHAIGNTLLALTLIAKDNGATLEECSLINLVKLRDAQVG